MKYKIMESSLCVDLKGKSRMVQLSLEAFAMRDGIIRGELTGGIDAPRIVISAEEKEDGSIVVCWKNPDTCGYSDCRYHYTDTNPHEDIYRITGDNQLEVNGKLEQFGMDSDPELVIPSSWDYIEKFFKKWGLQETGPSKEERERILELDRIHREKMDEQFRRWKAEYDSAEGGTK